MNTHTQSLLVRALHRYYLRPGEGRQLRTSLDTEVGYQSRRDAKGNTVASSGGGSGGEGA